ncbi:hypothetical protein ElyMa_002985500 [Elysia marginata]|uniref:Uncharacterized protein n=1 Tax=Elysia marginata TaxID=1093978 RepID=A0AAV4IBF3_9GAST|nr:hypothetical protein ElyMa_002985500 [Elysia marginata]
MRSCLDSDLEREVTIQSSVNLIGLAQRLSHSTGGAHQCISKKSSNLDDRITVSVTVNQFQYHRQSEPTHTQTRHRSTGCGRLRRFDP